MKKHLFIQLFIITFGLFANGQEIMIKSFSLQMEPMTVPMQRTDANGNVCALVKVIIPNAQASFEGSLIGDCDYKTSEYWCYLSPGSKQLRVKYPNCEPLMVNFEKILGDGLKSKQIYELHLVIPSISVELNQKIHTITLNVHSSDKNTLLGKSSFEQLDNLVVERFNRNGTLLDSFTYSKGVLASINGLYEFTVGAVVGDKFNVKADGYIDKMISFTDESRKSYDIELSPEKYNLKFQVVDSISKEPLIGVAVFRNRREVDRGISQWDNWDEKTELTKWDEGKVSDIDGITGPFNELKSTDNIFCSYVGYKNKVVNIQSIKNLSQSEPVIIQLQPYGEEEVPVTIHIGGMGTNDNGSVKVTNSRTGESITMSQKTLDNIKQIFVRLGDEIFFTRGGFRPVSARFEYSIPSSIWIAPIKGNKSEVQHLKY